MKRLFARKTTAIWILLLLLFCTFPVHAAGDIDTDCQAELTILHQYDGIKLSKTSFHLYRVADISESAYFTLSGDFSRYPVEINNLSSEGWKIAANTFSAYVTADQLFPVASQQTNEEGTTVFKELNTGLYLVIGEALQIGNHTYRVAPFFISMPDQNRQGEWNYSVQANTKAEQTFTPNGGGGGSSSFVDVSAIKMWNDSGHNQKRPSGIEVVLLKGGEPYDSVWLNEENYWRHTWKHLNESYSWTIIEKEVPQDYTVTYSGSQAAFYITNTYQPSIPDRPPNTPDTDDPAVKPPQKPVLPQSGQNRWPAFYLTIWGFLLFLFGWWLYFRKGDNKDENEEQS